MNSTIYTITNLITEAFYIGSTMNWGNRKKQHLTDLRCNSHNNKYLQSSWNKHGENNFSFDVLEEFENITRDELLKKEQEYIDQANKKDLYNLTMITNGGGADCLSKSCYLLNLKGDILNEYTSISELCRKNNHSGVKVNKGDVIKGKYRVVTKEFYTNNLTALLSWPQISHWEKAKLNKELRIKQLEDRIKGFNPIVLDINKVIIKEFDNIKELIPILNLTRERIRQKCYEYNYDKNLGGYLILRKNLEGFIKMELTPNKLTNKEISILKRINRACRRKIEKVKILNIKKVKLIRKLERDKRKKRNYFTKQDIIDPKKFETKRIKLLYNQMVSRKNDYEY